MKKIKTANFSKCSGSWDDQPNFYQPRYEKSLTEYLGNDGAPDNKQDIEKIWHIKKNKKKKRRSKGF